MDQYAPNQESRDGVQGDVHQVVAERIEVPEVKLEAINRERQRPVIDVLPDIHAPTRPPGLKHRIIQEVQIVVPNKPAAPRRLIRQEYGDQQDSGREPARLPETPDGVPQSPTTAGVRHSVGRAGRFGSPVSSTPPVTVFRQIVFLGAAAHGASPQENRHFLGHEYYFYHETAPRPIPRTQPLRGRPPLRHVGRLPTCRNRGRLAICPTLASARRRTPLPHNAARGGRTLDGSAFVEAASHRSMPTHGLE